MANSNLNSTKGDNMKKIFSLLTILFLGLCAFAYPRNFTPHEYTTVKASHILVQSEDEAKTLKTMLDEGEDFAILARQYSKCPSKAMGGDLGYFRRGQMVKEFETAAFNLPKGQISEPVQTQFGWHIIKVTDKK